MRIVDASAAVKLLIGAIGPESLGGEDLAAPHLIDSEVMHALRRLDRTARITASVGTQAVEGFSQLDVTRYSVTALIPRIWELRHNVTAYDATYVALAEALDATSLLTADARLARATGVRCAIKLI